LSLEKNGDNSDYLDIIPSAARIKFLLTARISIILSREESMNANVKNFVFSEIQGRRWNLTEVKNKSTTINIDRTKAPIDIYTIKFEPAHLTGAGAVNFYSASYIARKNQTLSIIKFARILNDTLYETEHFTEYEYFWYLQKVNRWDICDRKLELYTYDENGARVVLIFS
jgi:hypothetical protein